MTATPVPVLPSLRVQAFWLTFSKVVAVFLTIATPIVLVRLLNQADYGTYKQAFLFASSAVSLATFGVATSAFYFIPRFPERGGQVALNILLYNFAAGLIPLAILCFYPALLTRLFRNQTLQPLAPWVGLLVALTLSGILLELLPTALQDVRYSTVFVIGGQTLRAALVLLAALIFRTVGSLVLAVILTQIVTLAVLFIYLKKRFGNFWAHFDWTFFKQQLEYAIPMGAYGLMWIVQKDLDNYFVGHYLSAAQFAIYSVGWLEVPLINLFLESVAVVLVVRVNALHQAGQQDEIRRLTAQAINRFAAIQFPICILLLVVAHDALVLLYTKAYEKSATIFMITVLLLPLNAFLIDPIVRAYVEMRNTVIVVRLSLLVLLFASLGYTIQHVGMLGAAVLAVAAQYIERLIVGWRVARLMNVGRSDLPLYADVAKVLAVSLVAGAAAYALRQSLSPNLLLPRIVVSVLTVGAIYLGGTYLFDLPGKEVLSPQRLLGMLKGIAPKPE